MFWNYCLNICVFAPRQDIEMKQSIKYRSDSVGCFYTSFFQIVPLSFDITPPVLNKFSEPVIVKFFRLCWKPFCCSILNFFIACETIAFGMFLGSSEWPQVRQCQIQAIGRAWNNLKSDVITTEVATLIVWCLALSFLLTSAIYSCSSLIKVFM